MFARCAQEVDRAAHHLLLQCSHPDCNKQTHIASNMTITVVETYEEDSHIAVARHIASLLDEGQVGAQLGAAFTVTRDFNTLSIFTHRRSRLCGVTLLSLARCFWLEVPAGEPVLEPFSSCIAASRRKQLQYVQED